VTVTPSGTITSVTLSTPNARLTGSTSSWTSPANAVQIISDFVEACADPQCSDSSLRSLNLHTSQEDPPRPGATFQYLTWGDWTDNSAPNGTVNSLGGYLVVGQPTPPANIPTSGTATYTGLTEGAFANSATSSIHDFNANFSATANFSARTLAVSTSGMMVDDVSRPEHNYSGTLRYSAGSNQFSGQVTTPSGGTGTATGQFFGPAAQEIGGVVDISGGTFRAIGVFAGKR
jgi:hypothetical protein